MGADFMRPLRPRFHHLVALRRGRLQHTVDFTGYDIEPGTWLWVRPGQVQQWGDLAGADGTVIIFEQGFLDPATSAHLGDPHGAVVRIPAGADQEALHAATVALEREFGIPGRLPLETHLAILRHLLSAVVLNLAQLGASPGDPAPPAAQTFLRFRDAVETHFASARVRPRSPFATPCAERQFSWSSRWRHSRQHRLRGVHPAAAGSAHAGAGLLVMDGDLEIDVSALYRPRSVLLRASP